jgi:hypothetical protein
MSNWLTSPNSQFWLWLERISIVLSYGVVFSIMAFVYNVFRYRRKRTALADITGKSAHPMALALAFGGGSIGKAVEAYLKEAYPNVTIPVEEYIAEEVTPQNIHRYEEAIRRIKEKCQSENVTELHLFMKGPVGLALAVGAIFDNWVSVKIYQNNRQGNYEPWTTLDQAKAVPIADELAERALQIVNVEPQS